MKAKQSRESIRRLRLPDGRITKDESEILNAIFTFYSDLYTKDPRVGEHRALQEEALALITEKVSPEENKNIASLPSKAEIEKMVFDLPHNKVPGIDGVTAEMLPKGWDYMKAACIVMIQAYWRDGRLTTRASAGVIKLIPKNQETLELMNWWPLTMLTLTEKMIAKLLANWIKKVANRIVDKQQTGFLEGRDILDNLMTYKLAQEWAPVSKQPVIFLKLDFTKAYDWVDHSFLWAVLRAMDFDEQVIYKVRGMVELTHLKVHINGNFTEEIDLQGVRQGCPLSSLVFTLTTQPLMVC